MKLFLISLVLAVWIIGCATVGRINALYLGMSRADVVTEMGDPTSSSAEGNVEILKYRLKTNDGWLAATYAWYYVKLVNGQVVAYGQMGDFDSTPDVNNNINIINSNTR